MEISECLENRHDEVEDVDDNGGSDSELEYDSDDSENDPSYSILEETNSKLASLSIKKKSKPAKDVEMEVLDEADIDDVAPNVSTLDENNDEDIDEVQKIIKVGKLEKLKVEQCKAYLRKNGLRLTGNKDTLIQRINEHLEILNGGGEKRYPESSFVLNCKGDACTGDVVMFEQKVYEMYNIASRSSIGPSCGTRVVAGRIVKESYGASKQQHTFTIEVLWIKGEKALPPLHPLLIKGRNLYRLKTLRQRWKDEEERQKVLLEKHVRGSIARSDREVRVSEKEKRKVLQGQEKRKVLQGQDKRKVLQENRVLKKESFRGNSSESTINLLVESRNSTLQHQQQPLLVNLRKPPQPRQFENQPTQLISDLFDNQRKWSVELQLMDSLKNNYGNQASKNAPYSRSNLSVQLQHMDPLQNIHRNLPSRYLYDHRSFNAREYMIQGVRPGQHNYKQLQPCRYYAQGRCYYGENCKFSHGTTAKRVQYREERWC